MEQKRARRLYSDIDSNTSQTTKTSRLTTVENPDQERVEITKSKRKPSQLIVFHRSYQWCNRKFLTKLQNRLHMTRLSLIGIVESSGRSGRCPLFQLQPSLSPFLRAQSMSMLAILKKSINFSLPLWLAKRARKKSGGVTLLFLFLTNLHSLIKTAYQILTAALV